MAAVGINTGRLVGGATQGRGLVFRRNTREPGAQTCPESLRRLLSHEAIGTPRGVAGSLRGRLRLPGAGPHRGLVEDDGFTDASAQITSRFQVRLLTRDRLGLSEARNMALEQAQGGFVAYIDADAQADPDWLTDLALALEVPGTASAGGRTPSPQTTRQWPSAWRVRQRDRSTSFWTTREPSTCRPATWHLRASAFWRSRSNSTPSPGCLRGSRWPSPHSGCTGTTSARNVPGL